MMASLRWGLYSSPRVEESMLEPPNAFEVKIVLATNRVSRGEFVLEPPSTFKIALVMNSVSRGELVLEPPSALEFKIALAMDSVSRGEFVLEPPSAIDWDIWATSLY